MGRYQYLSLGLSLALAAMLTSSAPAAAQAPDVRNIRPVVMLMVDTSGSMERLGDCECRTAACTECLPSCSSRQENRWATVLQALTGGFSSFSCTTQVREGASYARQYDFGYFLPHFALNWGSQSSDGVLDVYRDRVRFGLMTFDGVGTFTDAPPVVPRTVFLRRLADSAASFGNFSYGTPRVFTFPGCAVPHMMDNGARNENLSAPGRLVSVGTDSSDHVAINTAIQSALLDPTLRPFGATPVAGMLDDLSYYISNHRDVRPVRTVGGMGDPYAACRSRYAVLLTDGYPNADMRGAPYGCEGAGYTCPYAEPEETARTLCTYSSATGACTGDIDGLYVVGFNVPRDGAVGPRLNALADAGGTGSAFFATDRTSLITAMSTVLDRAAPGTTTRTVPAIANAAVVGASAQAQLQFNTGFNLPIRDGNPWTGVLERRRIECRSGVPTPQPIDASDRFGVLLNTQTAPPNANPGTNRRLLTVRASRAHDSDKWLTGRGAAFMTSAGLPLPSASGIKQRNLSLVRLATTNTSLSRSYFGVSNDTQRTNLIDWLWGAPGTLRENAKMGDIYHSSPSVSAPPATDLADESYNSFRRDADVASRPRMVYVGTNDGIMHAFVADDHDFDAGRYSGQSLTAGTELWGFVPPALLEKLDVARAGHQWMVDGTPLVREVYVARTPDRVRADEWRTILVGTLRGGGNQTFALDVTDPMDPKFLWQFSDHDMGKSYAEPAMAQMLVETNGVVNERAVVIIGGGEGERRPGACPSSGIANASDVAHTPVPGRSMRRCWRSGHDSGRALYFIDAYTGRLIRKFDREFTAPLTGGISAFTGDTATVASRAFFTDADGVIWRADFADPDPRNWTVKAFYDIFSGMAADAGQPAYPPPVVTTNGEQEVVVLQATGDVDRLDESLVRNRVVSVTEKLIFDATGAVTRVQAYVNWQIDLAAGEQVTGPIELFNGNIYFGSFISISNELDACQFGSSRLWGVKFEEESGTLTPVGALERTVGSGTFVTYLDDTAIPALNNRILMGVAVAQRPSCFDGSDGSETDPYLGSRPTHRLNTAGQSRFELVAQISGGTDGASGGSVGEFTRQLPAPIAYTQPQGYAGTVE